MVLRWPLLSASWFGLLFHLHNSLRFPGALREPSLMLKHFLCLCLHHVCWCPTGQSKSQGQSWETVGRPLFQGTNGGRGVMYTIFEVYSKFLSQLWLFLGEANKDYNRDLYNCTFPALIEDWRQTFHHGSQGQTERFFPFGFVQVCVERRSVGIGEGITSFPWHPYSSFPS